MYRLIIFFQIVFLGCVLPIELGAQSESPSQTKGVTTVRALPAPALDSRGEIFFFVDKRPRPKDDRHHVKAGEGGDICLRIRAGSSKTLKEIKKGALGYRLILEDSKEPPNKIEFTIKNISRRIQEDPQGCYLGNFKIPETTPSGTYQIADLMFLNSKGSFISIREFLYELSHADELVVENKEQDLERPTLLEIQTKGTENQRFTRYWGQLRARVKNKFIVEDKGAGIEPESFRAFYGLYEDDLKSGIYEADCKPKQKRSKYQFVCTVDLIRPRRDWEIRRVRIELETLYLKDKANNLLVLSDPEVLAKKAQGDPTQVRFENIDKGFKRGISNVNRQRFIPKEPWVIPQ